MGAYRRLMEKYFEINEKGHNIRCKLYFGKIPDIKKVVVFCHGFAGHKDNKSAQRFAEKTVSKHKDTAIVTFNWPCHGDDVKKKLLMDDCTEYLTLVLEYVKKQFHTEDIYAYGTSFGGYMILKYIIEHKNPFKRIALRCPAITMHEAMTKTIMKDADFEKLEKGKPCSVGFDRKVDMNLQFLKDLESFDVRTHDYLDQAYDICILHGAKDEVIPFEESKKFADDNLIEFYPFETADHRFSNLTDMDLATKIILEFFNLQHS